MAVTVVHCLAMMFVGALEIIFFLSCLYWPLNEISIFQINVLIEDLGLEQVRHTKVASMTISEKRRLNVACQLLLDTDIVLLDQPTKGMDIFDTFFLVEYLRQWASGGTSNALGNDSIFFVDGFEILSFVQGK